MSSATIVEVLLALLTVVIGFVSYHGANRATKAQAHAAETEVDAEAYARARAIYEGAIDALEEHIERLKDQTILLDQEVTKLRISNAELRSQLARMEIDHSRMEAELQTLKQNGHVHE